MQILFAFFCFRLYQVWVVNYHCLCILCMSGLSERARSQWLCICDCVSELEWTNTIAKEYVCVWYFKTNSISSANFRLIHLIYRTIYARCSCTDHRPITRCTTHSLGIKVHFMRFSNIRTRKRNENGFCVYFYLWPFSWITFLFITHTMVGARPRVPKNFSERENLRPSYR